MGGNLTGILPGLVFTPVGSSHERGQDSRPAVTIKLETGFRSLWWNPGPLEPGFRFLSGGTIDQDRDSAFFAEAPLIRTGIPLFSERHH